jgi:hypothetical protein
MAVKKFRIHFFLLITLISCSQIAEKISNLSSEKKENSTLLRKESKNNCIKNNEQYLFENNSAEFFYKPIILKNNFQNVSIIEKGLKLALMEVIRRPDVTSPKSRLQVIMRLNGVLTTTDFSSTPNSIALPVFYGIDFLSKKYINKNINQMVSETENLLPTEVNVDPALASFISKNQSIILKNDSLSTKWIRGDDPITHFETYQRISLFPILNYFTKNKLQNPSQNILNEQSLKYKDQKENKKINCNFDPNSENDYSFINENEREEYNYIAIKNKKDFFIAIFSSTDNNINKNNRSLIQNDLPFFNFNISNLPVPICTIENSSSQIILTSVEGKSKSQHLKHLLEYEIYNSTRFENLQDILNFPRHLFLSNPDRILYESKRGRKDQLDFFLSMNFPIYHVDTLGNIFGFVDLSSLNISSLIYDNRSKAVLSCNK